MKYEQNLTFEPRGISIATVVNDNCPASATEKANFNVTMTNKGYRLFDPIQFEDYMEIALKHPCFIEWLLKEGYIKEKVEKWVQVGWKDIQSFQPGVILKRVYNSDVYNSDEIMEVTKEVYWRDFVGDKKLLAIRVSCIFYEKALLSGPSHENGYFLDDLFNGQVFMKVKGK